MKKPTPLRKWGVAAASLLALVLLNLTACSTPEPLSVEERAQQRWDHVVAREFEQAYEFFSPGYRETTPLHEYMIDALSRPVRWLNAEVIGASCLEDVCRLSVEVTYQPAVGPGPLRQLRPTRTIEERWIRIDGVWWYTVNRG